MLNDIRIGTDLRVGSGFVPPAFLPDGVDEYWLRNRQLEATGKALSSYRPLEPFELETLVRNNNTCSDWSQILVSDPFTPELVHNSFFSGLVRIGKLERVSLEHHDLHLFAGISNSLIIACDIGNDCVISNCSYISHYIIGDHCILIDNAEIHVSNHAKFGNGVVMEGESDDVRIVIDVMNEAGGRSIRPFEGMTTGDAYLWAKFRDRERLMERFSSMTDAKFDRRRGRYGIIGSSSVLKSNGIIKDTMIGESAYIKGSNKLKNLTINSSEESRTQIGEGVELVNGIIAYGCKVFYGCKAVRFVMCQNSSLKYGARLIHSVLGDNSTVSCCEILNNLIFPAHEQHHNTSFLIASLVKGQSNMAAGATIGSNHNSRSPDGEIEAGRGFWPGLCTSVKHSSRFASFCLLAKGDYRYELDIPLPFCLVDNDYKRDRLVLVPAYWWTSNMYALMRNEAKFIDRDKRSDKRLHLEYSPFAPDTAREILRARSQVKAWIEQAEKERGSFVGANGHAGAGADPESLPFEVFATGVEHSDRSCIVSKPLKALRAYGEMLLYFAGTQVARIAEEILADGGERISPRGIDLYRRLKERLESDPLVRGDIAWENLGGMLVAEPRLEALLSRIEAGAFGTWEDLHAEYGLLSDLYAEDEARYAWWILGELEREGEGCFAAAGPAAGRPAEGPSSVEGPTAAGLAAAFRALGELTKMIERTVFESRAKDWDNKFRKSTFRSEAEMLAVLGTPGGNGSIKRTAREMDNLRSRLDSLLVALPGI